MNLKEFYEVSGGDYEATVQRIRNEDMLKKFVMKYAADPSYSNLTAAVADKDWETAFRSVHTIKGIAQNLGFDRLQAAAELLTEDLRGPSELSSEKLLEDVSVCHAEIIDAIKALAD